MSYAIDLESAYYTRNHFQFNVVGYCEAAFHRRQSNEFQFILWQAFVFAPDFEGTARYENAVRKLATCLRDFEASQMHVPR